MLPEKDEVDVQAEKHRSAVPTAPIQALSQATSWRRRLMRLVVGSRWAALGVTSAGAVSRNSYGLAGPKIEGADCFAHESSSDDSSPVLSWAAFFWWS